MAGLLNPQVPILRLDHARDLPLPRYMTAGAVGMDLLAAMDAPVILAPMARALIRTGIAVAVPDGFEGQVRPRSGLALRYGVTVLNAPGTIDADYRGEIGVILINLGSDPFELQRGERIAQLVVAPVVRIDWHEVATLPDSDRAGGGFGHTGR
ncbi:MAG: dUTP diphosphatase [Magnetococcales bacterium]|nr:dUTP diphosphatase [Magnetococcales bacterium]